MTEALLAKLVRPLMSLSFGTGYLGYDNNEKRHKTAWREWVRIFQNRIDYPVDKSNLLIVINQKTPSSEPGEN